MWNVFHNLGGALIGNFRQYWWIHSYFFWTLWIRRFVFWAVWVKTAKKTDFNPRELWFCLYLVIMKLGTVSSKNIDRKVAWLSINFRNAGTKTKLSAISEKGKKHDVVDYSGAYESHFRITKCTQCDDNYMQTTLNFLIFQASKMTFRDCYQAVIYYFM